MCLAGNAREAKLRREDSCIKQMPTTGVHAGVGYIGIMEIKWKLLVRVQGLAIARMNFQLRHPQTICWTAF